MHAYRTHKCGDLRDIQHRRNRPPFRLVPSHPRPWRRAVHRPARPLRHDAMRRRSRFRRPSSWPKSCARNGWCGFDGAVRKRRRRAPKTTTCRPARSRSMSRELEVLGRPPNCRCRFSAIRTIPRRRGCKYRFLDLRREKLHNNIMLRGQVVDSMRARMKGQGFNEFQTPDPHRLLARKARATSWCRRASIPANSTRCRRRRSNTSNC